MELLVKTCVGFRGGYGGELKLGNIMFQVRHSSCIANLSPPSASNPSSSRAHASWAAPPAASDPQPPPLSTKIQPSAASTSSPLTATRLPAGNYAALQAAALSGHGFGGYPPIDGLPVRVSQPLRGASVPAAWPSAPQVPFQSVAGPPPVLSPAQMRLPYLPVRFHAPAAAQQGAAAHPLEATGSLPPGTAGARPPLPPARLRWLPPPALPHNPPAASQPLATTESMIANVLAGMQEASDEPAFLPSPKRLRSTRSGNQAKRPLSRRWPSSLPRIKRP